MTEITAFHVSSIPYEPRRVVQLREASRFVSRLASEDSHLHDVEEVIEAARPVAAQSRLTALYAYPTLGACRTFWEGERAKGNPAYQGEPNYYEVKLNSPSRVVCCLIHHASRRIHQRLACQEVVREFWVPTQEWKCFEYMCSEFTVERVLPPPTVQQAYAYGLQLSGDFALAQRLWPVEIKLAR